MRNLRQPRPIGKTFEPRCPRRQRQVLHLHKSGPRCVMEALVAVEQGQQLDAVLADFERLPVELFHATLYLAAALDDGDGR
jgi:hypothetical protein